DIKILGSSYKRTVPLAVFFSCSQIYLFPVIKQMEKKVSFLSLLLLIFVGFSLLISTIAVPSSRSLKTITENQDSHNKVVLMDELKKRELLVERDDYAGTGANNHHDPKPPGAQWSNLN
ncbi:hypothetical protein AABB24_026588, partial [Solanum stoloniferum]